MHVPGSNPSSLNPESWGTRTRNLYLNTPASGFVWNLGTHCPGGLSLSSLLPPRPPHPQTLKGALILLSGEGLATALFSDTHKCIWPL